MLLVDDGVLEAGDALLETLVLKDEVVDADMQIVYLPIGVVGRLGLRLGLRLRFGLWLGPRAIVMLQRFQCLSDLSEEGVVELTSSCLALHCLVRAPPTTTSMHMFSPRTSWSSTLVWSTLSPLTSTTLSGPCA